ncbi:hypothetical protein DSL72_006316 [Monilinia vaccinii-corymbosi]|uniref:Cytochrome P450 n=1 Tax=Monilinia vaccinii-corymbosi TaxID=61207 RepID=A0A8A3PLX1_9HELO|nr:hypothetical protein DSL72_006316 [Monilinia vaccinii-corymbosi]
MALLVSNNVSAMATFSSFLNLESYDISRFPLAIVLTVAIGIGLMILLGRPGRKSERLLKGTEPPEVKTSIPLFGHLVGLWKEQFEYFQTLSSKNPLYPAFTLKIFAARIYVICEPAMIHAAYRNTKAFDFTRFIVDAGKNAFNVGERGMKIIRGETSPDYDPKGPFLNGNDGRSYLNESHKLMLEHLRPGGKLLELNRKVLAAVAESLNTLGQNAEKVSIFKWTRDNLTLATTAALYGPQDPVSADHSLIDSFWDFDNGLSMLMVGFLPTFMCSKASQGRAAIKNAFVSYYASSHHTAASALVKSRLECAQKWGLTVEEISNIEISIIMVAAANSVPTAFWLLVYVLSDSSLISSIRTEISHVISRNKVVDGIQECVMDITLLQSRCPILVSCFRETLRLTGAAAPVRYVAEDALLASSTSSSPFLLKQGNIIQFPAGVTHKSPSIWGSNVESFDPYRFLPSTIAKLSKEQKKQQTQAYLPFGGGKHLCPGRQFATTEILALVGAIVMGFDVEGATVPEEAIQKLGVAVKKPKNDVEVNIRKRNGWENVRWRFDVQSEVDSDAFVREKNDI